MKTQNSGLLSIHGNPETQKRYMYKKTNYQQCAYTSAMVAVTKTQITQLHTAKYNGDNYACTQDSICCTCRQNYNKNLQDNMQLKH